MNETDFQAIELLLSSLPDDDRAIIWKLIFAFGSEQFQTGYSEGEFDGSAGDYN